MKLNLFVFNKQSEIAWSPSSSGGHRRSTRLSSIEEIKLFSVKVKPKPNRVPNLLEQHASDQKVKFAIEDT